MEPVLEWGATFRRGAGGGVILLRTSSGRHSLEALAADEFAALMAVLKQDQTTFYDDEHQALSTGRQAPGQ